MPRKIVVIGPESTGKSTLCEQLAQHYNTIWCPEYAREYLSAHGMSYTYDDLLTIARGQIELEEHFTRLIKTGDISTQNTDSSGSQFLFLDTDMHVMKVWCEFVFGKCHQYILDQIAVRKYDLYLLCNIDLEWTFDVLREYPDLESRRKLYQIYKDTLQGQETPWVEISGNKDARIFSAINAIDLAFKE